MSAVSKKHHHRGGGGGTNATITANGSHVSPLRGCDEYPVRRRHPSGEWSVFVSFSIIKFKSVY
jgi:hypothetical protein